MGNVRRWEWLKGVTEEQEGVAGCGSQVTGGGGKV